MYAKLARLAWQVAALKVGKGEKPIPTPQNFKVYESFSAFHESGLIDSLCKAYQRVFRESNAWQEHHSCESISKKLISQLSDSSVITLMMDDQNTVTGFCWGQITTIEQVVLDCQESISFSSFNENDRKKLSEQLKKHISPKNIVFIHELGILSEHRSGIKPLQFLLRPIFELGNKNEIKQLLWWTSKKSEAYTLSFLFGMENLLSVNDIVFMYSPNYTHLLKILRCFDPQKIAGLLRKSSLSKQER